jgi:AbrB family looped-hinge helix DNA binding protein
MNIAKIKKNYQVLLPKEIIDSLSIFPGQKIQIFEYDKRIEIIPVKDIREMRGFIKGIDTKVIREKNRL